MKRLILLLLLIPSISWGVEVQITQNSRFVDEDTWAVGSWEQLQINYTLDRAYIFTSYETFDVMPYGKAFTYTGYGFGLGFKNNLTKNIKVFGQFGYYFIENDWGRQRAFNESLYYYLNSRWRHVHDGTWPFETYSVENENALGGTVGIELTYPLTESVSTGFVMSYRHLKIHEVLSAELDVWGDDGRFEIGETRNYSSINVGINLTVEF